jgi:hypothetical protein
VMTFFILQWTVSTSRWESGKVKTKTLNLTQ